jgi:hypothetical protein
MRSFAHVEHPHLRQRPVALSACASHSGQARHVASRLASASGDTLGIPALAKRFKDFINLSSISGFNLDCNDCNSV